LKKRFDFLVISCLILIGLVLFALNVSVGEVKIPFSKVLGILGGNPSENASWGFIIENRLNRSVVAIMAGGGLAISGLLLQVYFRNPLAGPGVLGITSGASLGVALIILGGFGFNTWLNDFGLVSAGTAGAFSVLVLLFFISRYVKNHVTLLVVGLMLGYFVSALVSVLFLMADQSETREYVFWGLGSFEGLKTYEMLVFTVLIFASSIATIFLSKSLNALTLGSDYARSLGVNLVVFRRWIILITSIIAALVTVYCGPIGFIGIAVPQIIRLLSQSKNHAFIIPLCFVTGGVLGILADLIVRSSSNSLPLNTVTAIIGAPIIIWTIIKMNNQLAKN
jgi:iron complex transport system permease protein